MLARHGIGSAIAVVSSLPLAAQTLIWPGEPIATIDAPHLRAFVPAGSADKLRALVARADQIYAHMQHDAGYVPPGKLRVLMADWVDDHNGYSFVVPFPLVQIELAPSQGPSPIFAGGRDAERTLTHELAHELSNDRNQGFRGALESVFGRVLPNDLLSLLVWYLSTPAHQTQPRFWQEGFAVWAETSYADATSAWAGRGRDPLTHMIWRLDAAAGAVPAPGDWRVTWHRWPYGGEAYTYGTAYLRFLEGHLGGRASMWQLVRAQATQWPFFFDRGARAPTGTQHAQWIELARTELLAEQQRSLAALRAAPVTKLERRTPPDMVIGAPAWRADGALVFAAEPAQGRARLHVLTPDGALRSTGATALAFAPVRALPDGGDDAGIVRDEFNWRGIRRVEVDGTVLGWRLTQPDAGPLQNGARTLVAIQLRDGGGQDLVVHALRDGELGEARVLPTRDTPWTPALRRGAHGNELAWVETDDAGSRLVLGPLDGSLAGAIARRELWAVHGRILHPVWSGDGSSLYCCADHTGVANAYRLDVAADAVTVRSITNTIGGVLACVPSPDDKTLALVDHDERGPFVATMPNDPARYAAMVPTIELPWPAPVQPVAGTGATSKPTPIPPLPANAAAAITVEPYSGLRELRPYFWAPSTFAVPEGGYGVYGFASDPLLTHVVQAGAGVGLVEQEPVAFLSYDYLALPIEFGISGGRSERTYAETVVRGTQRFDYTETVAHGQVRVGRGLFALERTLLAYVAFGIEDHDEVDSSARRYAGGTYVKPPFRDTERYVEVTIGYDDSTFYPTSYTFEDGFAARALYRHSGFGGELERNKALGDVAYTWSLFPAAGHQVVARTQAGWSDGDDTLQGNFSIGGGLSYGLPRGYLDEAVATGRYLLAGSLAYRFPIWRPFAGGGTTPFRARQLVVELFGDTANVADDRLGGGTSSNWFTSVGAELFANAEFMDAIVSPGIGVAVQLDGQRDVRVWFTLGFGF